MFGVDMDDVARVVNGRSSSGAAAVIESLTLRGMSAFQAAVAAAAYAASQEQVVGVGVVEDVPLVVGVDAAGDCYLPVVKRAVRESVGELLGGTPTCGEFVSVVGSAELDREVALQYDCEDNGDGYHLAYVGDGGDFLERYDATALCAEGDVVVAGRGLDEAKMLGYAQPGLMVTNVEFLLVDEAFVMRVQVLGNAPRVRVTIPAMGLSCSGCILVNGFGTRVRSWWHDTRGSVVLWPGLEVVLDLSVVTGTYDFPVYMNVDVPVPVGGRTSLADVLLRQFAGTEPTVSDLHQYGASVAGLLARHGKTVADFLAYAGAAPTWLAYTGGLRVGAAVVTSAGSACEVRASLVLPEPRSDDAVVNCKVVSEDGTERAVGVLYRINLHSAHTIIGFGVGSLDSPEGIHYFVPNACFNTFCVMVSVPDIPICALALDPYDDRRVGRRLGWRCGYNEDEESSGDSDSLSDDGVQDFREAKVESYPDEIVELSGLVFTPEFVRADGLVAGTLVSELVGGTTEYKLCSFVVPEIGEYDYLVSDAVCGYWRDGLFVPGTLGCRAGQVIKFRMGYNATRLVMAVAAGKFSTEGCAPFGGDVKALGYKTARSGSLVDSDPRLL